jgi:hypothetical protein
MDSPCARSKRLITIYIFIIASIGAPVAGTPQVALIFGDAEKFLDVAFWRQLVYIMRQKLSINDFRQWSRNRRRRAARASRLERD